MEVAAHQGHRRTRQRREEVHDDSERPIDLRDAGWQGAASKNPLLGHEDVGTEECTDHQRECADDVERTREDPHVSGDRLTDGHAGHGVDGVCRGKGRAEDRDRRDRRARNEHADHDRRDGLARAGRRDGERNGGRDADREDDRKRERVVGIATADREGVQRAEEEAQCDEIAETRACQEHDGAGAQVRGHEERPDQVPGAVQRLGPAEGGPHELRPRADSVPEQTDGPHKLESLPAAGPLGEDSECEGEAHYRGAERQNHVRAHLPNIRRHPGEVNRDAQICREAVSLFLMCRSIKTLRRSDAPATDEEIRAAALQFVRKVSGYRSPSRRNTEAFDRAVDDVSDASRRLLEAIEAAQTPVPNAVRARA